MPEEINKELVIYRLDEIGKSIGELKSDISNLSMEVKNLANNGCSKGQKQDMEIALIKTAIVELKERPQRTVVLASAVIGLILTILGALLYLHASLGNTNTVVNAPTSTTKTSTP
jgi:hypothetical protein